MSTVTTNQSPSKYKKEREKDRREKSAPQPGAERLKTVVRRLPPNLPEDVFWQTVQRWVTDETAIWKRYYPGKFKKRMNKENIPSRAYIAFKDEELLIGFSRDFDGHLFKDKAGNESYAIVEYAPHQKVPSEKRKQDNKNNTIEKDDDYISFLESLNTPDEPVSMESLIASARPPSPPKTTPLLEALKAEKSAQKDKDAILRNHAHYKEGSVAAIATNPNRKEEKKKAVVPPPPPIASQASKGGEAQGKKAKKGAREAAQPQKTPAVKLEPKPAPSSSKPSRQQLKQARIAAQIVAAANHPPPPPVILAARPVIASAPAAAASTAAQEAGSDAPPAPQPQRRVRAVLGRHLEVALAGVGASARARKERERERTKEASDADAAKAAAAALNADMSQAGPAEPATPSSLSVPAPAPAPLPPPSPTRHRHRRGGGPPVIPPPGQAAAAASVVSSAKPIQHSQSLPGAPTILQKNPLVPPTGPGGGHSDRGRGGRRGRGRGGGRGGGAQASRGG